VVRPLPEFLNNHTMQRTFLTLFLMLIILASCNRDQKPEPIRIGITKLTGDGHYSNYGKFILAADSTVELVDLYHTSTDSGLMLFENCDGLLICGGPDIYPAWYGKEEDTALCGSFDRRRDTLEYRVLRSAIEREIPVLGICRGLQMINVAMGGTLYADIPTQYTGAETHRCKNPDTCYHAVYINDKSLLFQITNARIGVVNTNHHQGIEKLAPPLHIAGRSDDKFPEVIQWKDTSKGSWLLGVQWHPERLNYDQNPYSLPIGKAFMRAVKEKKAQNSN